MIKIKSKIFSELLSKYILSQDGFNLISETQSSNSFPDIIVTDINELTDSMVNKYSKSKIVLIDTGLNSEELISNLIKYKLRGIICFSTGLEQINKALRVINDGQLWVSNSLMQELISRENFNNIGKIKVTDKEKEIIELVCDGLSNKEIAIKLFVSEQTIKAHLHRIFQKFNIKSRSRLVKIYSQNIH